MPGVVDGAKTLAEPFVEGRHLHREIADRATVEEKASLGILLLDSFEKSLEDVAQCLNRIPGVLQGFHPPVLDGRGEEFVQNRIAQLVLARKVMEQGALGDTGRRHDAIDAPALESVPVKLAVAGFQHLASGPFGITHAGHGRKLTYLAECCKRGLNPIWRPPA